MTDQQLISEYQSGNNAALGTLYSRYKEQLYWFIYQRIGNEQKAEDVVQDTFLHFIRFAGGYEPKVKVSTYLHMIAKQRLYSNHYRKTEKNKSVTLSKDDDTLNEPINIQSKDISPEDETDTRMQLEYLRKKIKTINPDYAQVIKLYCFQEYEYEEIAEMLDIKIGTVKSRIYRGRKALQ